MASVPRLVGREKEMEQVENFVDTSLTEKRGGACGIAGKPGTGKTSLITQLCKKYKQLDAVRVYELNGMRCNGDVWDWLCQNAAVDSRDELKYKWCFRTKMTKRVTTILCLDEIDKLLMTRSGRLAVSEMLDWTVRDDARFIVIYISNEIDIMDRNFQECKKYIYLP